MMTAKEIYKDLYRRAREFKRIQPTQKAFWLEDAAVSDFFEDGHYDEGIDRVLAIGKAVLWALHWKFDRPAKDKRWWQSERHLCFVLAHVDSGEESRVWYGKPQLPGVQ